MEFIENMGKKYDKYVNRFVDSLTINRDPKKWDVWDKVTVPMIFNKTHFDEMPIHVESLIIHKAGSGWGLNHPTEGTLGGKEYKDVPMYHDTDEVYMLIGTDPQNPHDLGGEIELWLGEGEESEKFSITESICIYIPANLVHMPVYFKRVDRPIMMVVVLVGTSWKGGFAKELPPDCDHIWQK